jgi:hypothetical protein
MKQRLNMNYMVAYLVKIYGIPSSLMINLDQTDIHLVPTVGAKYGMQKVQKM